MVEQSQHRPSWHRSVHSAPPCTDESARHRLHGLSAFSRHDLSCIYHLLAEGNAGRGENTARYQGLKCKPESETRERVVRLRVCHRSSRRHS
eukprot:21345-Prymnesium_polylepis.1